MKYKALDNFVYKGKDVFAGNTANIDERDVVGLARRGLIKPVEKKSEKGNGAGQSAAVSAEKTQDK